MLANAVSSALERLYATAPVADDRSSVQRITAVSRIRSVGDDDADKAATQRDEREQATQRQALTRGVRAVFETTASNETSASISDAGKERNERAEAAAESLQPDPLLEEAILRFIHTMFRSLAEAEGVDAPASDVSTTKLATAGDVAASAAERLAGPRASASRSALGARIGALAQRYAEGAPDEPSTSASAGSSPSGASAAVPDPALSQAFAEVLQALRGNLGGSAEVGPNSRGELVNLMQRLAQAMQGAPPVDPGLPTRGGLLSTRA